MSEMDFEGALEDFETGYLVEYIPKHKETIQTALRLAKRMQSGEVSEEMNKVGCAEIYQRNGLAPDVFNVMSQQLMKEVSDE